MGKTNPQTGAKRTSRDKKYRKQASARRGKEPERRKIKRNLKVARKESQGRKAPNSGNNDPFKKKKEGSVHKKPVKRVHHKDWSGKWKEKFISWRESRSGGPSREKSSRKKAPGNHARKG